MQKKIIVLLLSFVFVLGFSVDAEAQSRKKKKGKQRPAKTEEVDENNDSSERSSRSSSSQRSSRVSDDEGSFFTNDKLVYDLLGDFEISRAGGNSILKFGIKPAIAYKVWPRVSFGLAPKVEYYFFNIVNQPDLHEFDLGIEAFGRVLVIEAIYLQLGYDFNNSKFAFIDRTWLNSPMIGGGYMNGFGQWRYGAQALLALNEERRDQYGIVELWFGLTYNL